jgi:hypothetical protein
MLYPWVFRLKRSCRRTADGAEILMAKLLPYDRNLEGNVSVQQGLATGVHTRQMYADDVSSGETDAKMAKEILKHWEGMQSISWD